MVIVDPVADPRDGLAAIHTTTRAEAVWFTAPGRVEIREEFVPMPNQNQVLVETLASGISQGTEMLVLRGEVAPDLPLDLPSLEGSFSFPIKFGYACVGRVAECGSDVETLSSGDLVFVHHPHQTHFVVRAEQAVSLPPDVCPETATLLANLETAVNVMLDAHPRFGDRVIVFGLGIVGLLTSQLMSQAGIERLVLVEPDDDRRQCAQSLLPGAEVIHPEEARDSVGFAGRGNGFDLAVECSGNPAALNLALDCMGLEATVVAVSWYGMKPVTLDLGGRFHRNRLRVISSQVGNIDPSLRPRWNRSRRMNLASQLLTTLKLEPLITHHVPFREAGRAYRLVGEPRAGSVQVVLAYGREDGGTLPDV